MDGEEHHVLTVTRLAGRELPLVKVLGTGGTIAAKGSLAFQTAGYEVDVTVEDLIAAIPDLLHTCELQYEQVFNLDSKDITSEHLLVLRNKISDDLRHHDAVVVTHGTDLCEETAFFLDSTLNSDKPVVLCGSMRPLTLLSADGPLNLYQACVVAANAQSRSRGVLVTLNDKIGLGYYITKSDANSLDTFKLLGQGYLGNFVNGEVHYYYPALRPTGLRRFAAPLSGALPHVVVLSAYQDFDVGIARAVLAHCGVRGLVMATMGAGLLPAATNAFLGEYAETHKIPIVYLKRLMDGMVPRGGMPKTRNAYLVAGGYLNPQKARLFLMLCLHEGMGVGEIRAAFRGVYGG